MKYLITLFIACTSIFYFPGNTIAQEKAKTEITKVQLKDQTVEFTVASTKKFYVGNNKHILHIGNKDFSLSKQSMENGKSTLTFLIPATDFNALTEGDDVWLSYGDKLRKDASQKENIELLCKNNPGTCWSLGKFSKQNMTK